MKKIIYISFFLVLLAGCVSKKDVTKTHRIVTREIDTLVAVPGKTVDFFVLADSNIERFENRETGEVTGLESFFDMESGVSAEIEYEEVQILPGDDTVTYWRPVNLNIDVLADTFDVKAKETMEEDIKEKKVEGIPWFYKASLFIVVALIILLIIRYFLKTFPL